MSFTQIPNDWINDHRLTSNEFRLLCKLISFSEGRRYPTLAHLVKTLGIGRKSIQRALGTLKEKNIISWVIGHKRQSNVYTVNPHEQWFRDTGQAEIDLTHPRTEVVTKETSPSGQKIPEVGTNLIYTSGQIGPSNNTNIKILKKNTNTNTKYKFTSDCDCGGVNGHSSSCNLLKF